MLRLCTQNLPLDRKVLYQPIVQKQITSKFKPTTNCPSVFLRHYAIKLKDDDTKLECIYYGPLTPQIKGVKVFSLSSSAAGLLAQPIIIREAATIGNTSLLVALCSIVGFFTFVTPLLLHAVTRKYVTEIHYDPKTATYIATTINFFVAKKKTSFKLKDVQLPEYPGVFTTLYAKGNPLFIEPRHFTDPQHYVKLMGYDKPIDFKLGDQTADNKNTNQTNTKQKNINVNNKDNIKH